MAKHITPPLKAEIIAYLAEWAQGEYGDKLKWEVIERAFGVTRQGIFKGHREIVEAFQNAKTALKHGVRPRDKIDDMQLKITRLQDRMASLEDLVARYEEKWVTWRYNAAQRGMTEEELNRPLPEGHKKAERRRKH